jgi:hypothetical protein
MPCQTYRPMKVPQLEHYGRLATLAIRGVSPIRALDSGGQVLRVARRDQLSWMSRQAMERVLDPAGV